jgi:hypothetical protein
LARLLMSLNDFDVPVFRLRPPNRLPEVALLPVLCWNALPLWTQDVLADATLAVFFDLLLIAFYVFGQFNPYASVGLAVAVLLGLFLSDSEFFKRTAVPRTIRFFAGPARPLRKKMHSYIVTASNTQLVRKTTHRTQFNEASDESVQESKSQPPPPQNRERLYSADNDSITTTPSITGAYRNYSDRSRRQQEIFELKTRSIQIKPVVHSSSDYFHNSQIHENYNFDSELLSAGSRLTRPPTTQPLPTSTSSPGDFYDPYMSQMSMGTAGLGFSPQKSQEVGYASPTATHKGMNLDADAPLNEADEDGDEIRDTHPAETQWNERRQAALKSHRRTNRFAHEVRRSQQRTNMSGYLSPGSSTVRSGYDNRSRGGSLSGADDDFSQEDASTIMSNDNASTSDIRSVSTRYQRRRNKNRHRDVDRGPGSAANTSRSHHDDRIINQPYIDNIGDMTSNMSRLVLAADTNFQAPLPAIDIFGAVDDRGGGSSVASSVRGGRAARRGGGGDSSRRSSESSNNKGPGYH